MSLLLSSFIFALSCAAKATEPTCISGKISQIIFGNVKEEPSNYCFNSDKTALLSKNCREKKCSAFRNGKRFKIGHLLSDIGKPGFRLCREIGGTPELVEFSVGSHMFKLDRCLFKDGSFSDTDSLLAYYLEK